MVPSRKIFLVVQIVLSIGPCEQGLETIEKKAFLRKMLLWFYEALSVQQWNKRIKTKSQKALMPSVNVCRNYRVKAYETGLAVLLTGEMQHLLKKIIFASI